MTKQYSKEFLSTYSINDGWGDVGVGWTCPHCEENHNWEYVEQGEEYTCDECTKVSIAEYSSDY